jgi:hypothetical protein
MWLDTRDLPNYTHPVEARAGGITRLESIPEVNGSAGADDDVVDRDEDELDKEADESHDDEADRSPRGDLGELCANRIEARARQIRSDLGASNIRGIWGLAVTLAVRLVAALDEADAVLGELPERVDYRVNCVHGGAGRERSRGVLFACLDWRRRRRRCGGFARALPSRGGGLYAWMCRISVPRHT